MAKKSINFIERIIESTTTREQLDGELQNSSLMYSVYGFISATDGTDNVLLISNLGYVLAQKGFNVCLVDFKVFSPNLYMYLNVPHNKRGKGLMTVLKDDKANLREEINKTSYDRLYLLSSSPQDLNEEFFDFSMEKVLFAIESVRKLFDIVLIDIPYIPPLEFCIGAMQQCHLGFFTASERVEALSNMTRVMDFADSLGISVRKFTNVILTNMQFLKYDVNSFKKMNFDIVAGLPFVKGAVEDALEGKLYIKDNTMVNNVYRKELSKIVDRILIQG